MNGNKRRDKAVSSGQRLEDRGLIAEVGGVS
jgi:hypothetical protein